MIRELTFQDKKKVLDFCYKREMENLFVIGSFENYENTFEENKFIGYFIDHNLVGLAVLFKRFSSYIINSDTTKITEELLDYGIQRNFIVECIPVFKKYGGIMIQRLESIYNIKPKILHDEVVLILLKEDFRNFSEGDEEIATIKDVDEIAIFSTGKNPEEITEKDRKRIFPHQEFILRKNGKILSKANIHGVSKNFFQIGGVGTLEKFRKKGYAKKVVSKLCHYFFEKDLKCGLLFTRKENYPALELYKKIGFKPIDEFIIAEF
jgi:uncharacterized protein